MEAFGVRFAVNDTQRFEALRLLYAEVKRDKDAGHFRDPAEWVRMVPDEAKARFACASGGQPTKSAYQNGKRRRTGKKAKS